MMRFSLLVMVVFILSCSGKKADKVYFNGNIWTGDVSNPVATVIAIKDGKIVYVGDDADAYSASEKIDLEGKLVVPGFTDNHTHFLSAGYGLSSVKLKDAMTKSAFIQRIADFCKSHPDSTWVMEGSWDHENWGGELPSKEWIDSLPEIIRFSFHGTMGTWLLPTARPWHWQGLLLLLHHLMEGLLGKMQKVNPQASSKMQP